MAAPGVNIYSSMPSNSYDYLDGTSMATPYVSGVAALILSQFPDWTAQQVRLHLQETAEDLGDQGRDDLFGYGLVNAFDAVQPPPEHNLKVYLSSPNGLLPNSSSLINVTVYNAGLVNESNVLTELWINNSLVDSTVFSEISSGSYELFTYNWTVFNEGTYNITAYAHPVVNESTLLDNFAYKEAFVSSKIIGFIYTHGEYTLSDLKTFYEGFGFIVDEITTELTEEGINKYAFLFVGEGGSAWTINEVNALENYMQNGGTFIAIGDSSPADGAIQIANNNGITFTNIGTGSSGLTTVFDVDHPLMENVGSLYLSSVYNAMNVNGLAKPLIWDNTNTGIYGATVDIGFGHFFVLADDFNLVLYYEDNEVMFANILDWPNWQPPEHDLAVSLEAPLRQTVNEMVTINTSVFNLGWSNETDVEIEIWINGILEHNYTFPLLTNGSIGTTSYDWTPLITGNYNVTVYAKPTVNETQLSNNIETVSVLVSEIGNVAVLQDANPWSVTSNFDILNSYGITYDVIPSTQFGLVDLSAYQKVIISSDQPQSFYNALNTYLGWFEDYATGGGILEIHGASNGWNSGSWVNPIPGGFIYNSASTNNIDIIDNQHPILSVPYNITDTELDGWGSSAHGYLSNINASNTIFADGSNSILVELAFGSGTIIVSTQTLEYGYSNSNSNLLENLIVYLPASRDHDLSLSLENVQSLLVNETIIINATVSNTGLNNETDIEMQLWINNSLVRSQIHPLLLMGFSETLNFTWNPTIEGLYNITAFVFPVTNETYVLNNLKEEITFVGSPIVQYSQGDFVQLDDLNGFWANFTYESAIDSTHVYVDMGNGIDWFSVNILTRLIEDGTTWIGSYWPGQIETFIDVNDTIDWLSEQGIVVGTAYYDWNGMLLEAWNISLITSGAQTFHHKETGIWLDFRTNGTTSEIFMVDTNFVTWQPPEHDLTVSLEAPNRHPMNEITLINSTIFNRGTKNETDVEVQLWIDNNLVYNYTYLLISSSSNESFTYNWTPGNKGSFNITVYVLPTVNETYTINNKETQFTSIFDPDAGFVAILDADGTDRPSYWTGGWTNNYLSLYNGLVSIGIPTIVINNSAILSGILDEVSVLILVDNAPSDSASALIKDWYFTGGSVLTFDSSISFLNWAGILPPEADGSNGYNVYWDYGSTSTGIVTDDTHPVMAGYTDGQIISGTSGDAQYFSSVMQGTSAGIYYNPLVKTALGSNYDLIVAYEPLISGLVVQIWAANHWLTASNQMLIENAVQWLLTSEPSPHELTVSLEHYQSVILNETVNINVTVSNRGLTNETDVEVQLWINNSLVVNQSFPSLVIGDFQFINYSWTPAVEGFYNITAYVVPATNETYILNNVKQVYSLVADPILSFNLGDYVILNDPTGFWVNFSYSYFIDTTHIYVDMGNGIDWVSVNILTRLIEDGTTWVGSYWPGQVETSISINDTINWISEQGLVVGTAYYDWNGMLLEAWNISLLTSGGYTLVHKSTGIWLESQISIGVSDIYMVDTNMIIWQPPAHDLDITFEVSPNVPVNEITPLNITIHNRGLNNESNIELQIFLNGIIEYNYTFSLILNGTMESLVYNWTPSVQGDYNITVYVVPVINETFISNNIYMASVSVSEIGNIAVLQDANPWSSTAIFDILNAYGVTYDIIPSSQFGLIDLSYYQKVIISSDQPQTFYNNLNAYLSWIETFVTSGGILEVHGASSGWNGGSWVNPMPGGITYVSSNSNSINIVDPLHPVLSYPFIISDSELDSWGSSTHGYLNNIGSADVILDNGLNPVLIEFSFGSGTIITSTQTLEYGYDRAFSNILENLILYLPASRDHDLSVTLEHTQSALLNETIIVNATVINRGLNNETDIEVQLWINNSLITNQTFSSLLVGNSATLNYSWTPIVEGYYNVTAYVVPVTDEVYIFNNFVEDFSYVADPIIQFSFGDYVQLYDPAGFWANFSYISLLDATHVYVDMGNGIDWFSVNILTRLIEDGTTWIGSYWPGQVEASIGINDTLNWLSDQGTVVGTAFYDWNGMLLEAWNISILSSGLYVYHHKESGIWLDYQSVVGISEIYMVDTNMIIWQPPAHDLFVNLDVSPNLPVNEISSLNITIHNRGLNNETNVELQIIIDNILEYNYIFPLILNDTLETLLYNWTPSILGNYNITVYIVPVINETLVSNNIDMASVSVTEIGNVAVLQDANPWSSTAIFDILDTYGISYDVIPSSQFGLVDLSNYQKVIISSDQPQTFYDNLNVHLSWFETYVSSGGNLEIHGASNGWNGGGWVNPLPGGFTYVASSSNTIDIVDPFHPVLLYPFIITDSELDSWGSSAHGYLNNIGSADVILDNGLNPVFVELAYGSGTIIVSTQTLEYGYKNSKSNILENLILYFPASRDHDLSVSLEHAPELLFDNSVSINATVINRGLNDETNIELQLWINNSLVAYQVYPTLLIGNSVTITYIWTPIIEGFYNLTVYAFPVNNETRILNNMQTEFSIVKSPIIQFNIGDYISLNDTGGPWYNFTYLSYVDDTHVYIESGTDWFIVDTLTRLIEDGSFWVGLYWLAQIETNVDIGDTIEWHNEQGVVVGSSFYNWNGTILETWNISLQSSGYYVFFHKDTGVWVDYRSNANDSVIFLHDTNMIIEIDPPLISNPADIAFEKGDLGYSISWTLTDQNPDLYIIYINGQEVTDDPWISGETILVKLDSFSIGTHNFTILVIDKFGNYNSDSVIVTITIKPITTSTETTTTSTDSSSEPTSTSSSPSNSSTSTTQSSGQDPIIGISALVLLMGSLGGATAFIITRRRSK
ncbi:MAG: CARDB domain-containing protein [Candidatus Hodarchaeales archaeon]